MKFTKDLATIHAYLCADGYVVKNPPHQKHRYYHIALRNTNLTLLKDFQICFARQFGVTPKIYRTERAIVHSKQLYYYLTKSYNYYSYEWELPTLSRPQLRCWLRAFFDCEGWVELQQSKSRSVRLDSVNQSGLLQVQAALRSLGVSCSLHATKRMWRLSITGRVYLHRFQKMVGFLHPEKQQKLDLVLRSYRTYGWQIPVAPAQLLLFIREMGKPRKDTAQIRFSSIKKDNLIKLAGRLQESSIPTTVHGPWQSGIGSRYYCLTLRKSDLRVLEGYE